MDVDDEYMPTIAIVGWSNINNIIMLDSVRYFGYQKGLIKYDNTMNHMG